MMATWSWWHQGCSGTSWELGDLLVALAAAPHSHPEGLMGSHQPGTPWWSLVLPVAPGILARALGHPVGVFVWLQGGRET